MPYSRGTLSPEIMQPSVGCVVSGLSHNTWLLPSLSADQPHCLSFLGHLGPIRAVRTASSAPKSSLSAIHLLIPSCLRPKFPKEGIWPSLD